jgi:hypothetical protein
MTNCDARHISAARTCHTNGVRLQVDYGKDETALVYVRLMMAFTTPLNDPTCRQADRHAVADFERFIWIL